MAEGVLVFAPVDAAFDHAGLVVAHGDGGGDGAGTQRGVEGAAAGEVVRGRFEGIGHGGRRHACFVLVVWEGEGGGEGERREEMSEEGRGEERRGEVC